MSENVEIVRSIYALGRGDFRSVEWAHPEIEFVTDGGPASGSWKGLAAMAEAWRSFLSTWEEYRAEVERYRDLDDERVLVLLHVVGRGKTSGVELGEMRTKAANLFHIRDGKVDEARSSTRTASEALEASASRSKTLTPTPEPAGYCAGDVAGERGDRAALLRGGGATSQTWGSAGSRRTPWRAGESRPRLARRRGLTCTRIEWNPSFPAAPTGVRRASPRASIELLGAARRTTGQAP